MPRRLWAVPAQFPPIPASLARSDPHTDRVQELLQARISAAAVAAAAQAFGQKDDISVIAVTRTAVLVPA
jgi:hypothetical protein